ncbi:ESX secretion-associated protein EspG [Nocardia takedensis]|uniref:ESX secretion-associated protein EspG n=1 Tax=Nocardia takedensis TaxID=259390 RepID=UPI000687FE37|nr:ESX secretion-associated protein EspG [Nocardia takedensis]
MTILGEGRGPSMLGGVVLSLDEMQYLMEELQTDEMPIVLQVVGRYDNETAHDAAMAVAAQSLIDRDLLIDGAVHQELEDRLRTLNHPHWVLAVRWVVDGQVSRMCLAKGDELTVVALRGPESYVIDEVEEDLPAPVIAALGPAEAMDLTGMNAQTDLLAPIFGDTGDAAATANRLAKVGHPGRDAQVLASALVDIHSHAQITGIVYGDGTREIADNHIAVFNTRGGRFLITASVADDGTKWSSISGGTTARLRQALLDLMNSLPEREEFPPIARRRG